MAEYFLTKYSFICKLKENYIMKIFILMSIIIGCSLLCLLISYAFARAGWCRPYTSAVIVPIIFLAVIFCIPVLMYIPHMPMVSVEQMKDASEWISLGSAALNGLMAIHGITVGYKKRLEKGLR